MLYQLVYTSQAGRGLDFKVFETLAKSVHSANHSRDITGMLLYERGTLIHVLEGPEETIKALFDVISRDTRHSEVMIMAEQHTQNREFPNQPCSILAVKAGDSSEILRKLVSQTFFGHSLGAEDEDCIFAQAANV